MLRRTLIVLTVVVASILLASAAPADTVSSETPPQQVTNALGDIVVEFPAVDHAVDQALTQSGFEAASDVATPVVRGGSMFSVPTRPNAIEVPGVETGSTEFHFGSDVVRFMLEGQNDSAPADTKGSTSSREDVFPGVDSHHISWNGGVEEFLHVSEDSSARQFTWLVDLPDGWSLVSLGDGVEVLDADKSSVLQFRAPWAQESDRGQLGRPNVQLDEQRDAIQVKVPASIASGEYVLDPVWLLSGAVGNYRWRSCGDDSAPACDHGSTTVPSGWAASTSSGDNLLFTEAFTADKSAVLSTVASSTIPASAYSQWTYTPPTGIQVKQLSWLGTQTLSDSSSPMTCQVGWAEDGSTFSWSSGSVGTTPAYEATNLGTYPSPDDLWLSVGFRLVNTGSSYLAPTLAVDKCETITQNNHLTLLLFDKPDQAPEVSVSLDDTEHDGIVGPAQPSVDVTIETSDVGSGVRRVERAVDGIGYAYVGDDCSVEVMDAFASTPCALTLNLPSAPQALSGLSDGTHEIHARAEDFAGNISSADVAEFEWDSVAPTAPSAIKLTGTDQRNWLGDWYLGVDDEASASWTSATDSHLLRHEARIVGATEACTTAGGVTSWTTETATSGAIDMLSLTSGDAYKWCVRGVDSAGNVSSPASLTFVVDTEAPLDVDGLSSPVSTDPAKLHVAWTTGAIDASPIRYDACGSSVGIDAGAPLCDLGTWYPFGPTSTAATATIDAGVDESETVYACVRARDLFERISDGVCVTANLDFTAPPRPTDVIDGASGPDVDLFDPIEPLSGDDRLDARWTASTGADSYLSCFTQLTSCHPSAPVTPLPGSSDESVTIWSITDMFVPGTLIRFCISARDAAGNISPTTCSDGAVIDEFPPSIVRVDDGPTADIARQTSTSTYQAHWTAEYEFAPIDEYQWTLCAVPCVTPTSGTTSSTSVSLTGLALGLNTTYRLCVTAVDVLARESDPTCSNGTRVFEYSTDVGEVHDGELGYDQDVIAAGSGLKANWYRSPSANPEASADWQVCSVAACGLLGANLESSGTDDTGSINASVTVTQGTLYFVCVEIPGAIAATCSNGARGADFDGGGTGTVTVNEVPVSARQESTLYDVDEIKFGDAYVAAWSTWGNDYSTVWRVCEESPCVTEIHRGVYGPLRTSISFEQPPLDATWFTCVVIVDRLTGDALTSDTCSNGATIIGSSQGTLVKSDSTAGSSLVSQDTVWRAANSPYIIEDSITVGEDVDDELRPATLTIEPGVVVKFKSGASIRIASGSDIVTNGSRTSPVTFTSYHDDSVGGDTDLVEVDPTSAPWNDFQIDEGAGGTLNGLVVKFAGTMNVYGDDVTWRNGGFSEGVQTVVEGYRTRFENLLFADNSGPVFINVGGSVVMRDSVVDAASTVAGLELFVNEEATLTDPVSPRSVFIGNTFKASGDAPFAVSYATGSGPVFSNGPLIRNNNLRLADGGGVVTGATVQMEPSWAHNYWGVAPAIGDCIDFSSNHSPTAFPTVVTDFTGAHDAAVTTDDWQYCGEGFGNPVDGIVTHPAYSEAIGLGVVDDARLGTDEDLQPQPDLDATDPVNTFIGNFHHTRADLDLHLPGENPEIARTYNSLDIMPGVFGDGWSSVLDTSLEVAGDRATFRSESGQRVEFGRTDDHGWKQLGSDWTRLDGNAEVGFVLRVRDGRTYGFDGLGRLASRHDRHGNGFSIEREVDPEEDFTITDTAGVSVAVDIDAARVQSLTSSDGRTVSYEYDEAGGRSLTSVTDEYSGTWQYAYDTAGRLACEKNPNDHVVFENEYAPNGEVSKQWDGARGGCASLGESVTSTPATEFEFDRSDAQAPVTTVTDPAGGEWIHTYDVNGAATSSTDPTGNCTSFEYDQAGNLVTEIKPNGLLLSRTHDERGRVTSTAYTRASGTWNCAGAAPAPGPDELDEPFTDTVTYDDDTSNVLTSERQYAGAVVPADQRVFTYDQLGNLQQLELVGSSGTSTPCETGIDRCVTLEHDAHGQLVSQTDARGKTSTYAWDVRGHQVRVSPAGLGATRTKYDGRGRPIRTIRETAGFVTGLGASTWFIYDDGDAGDHRLLQVIDPNGATTTYDRDLSGNITDVVDAEDRHWSSEYNEFEELARESGPGLDRSYEYDERGLLVAIVDGGERTEYEHDAAGRPDRIVPPRGTASGATPADFDWNTTYSSAGDAIQVDGPEGTRLAYEYDLLGRRVTQRRIDSPSTIVLDSVTNVFDDQSREVVTTRREGSATTGGLETEISTNEFGDIVSRTDERGKTWTYSSDAAGNRLREISPDGRISGWEYDDAGNVVAAIGPRGFEDPLAPGSSVADPFDPDGTTYADHRIEIERNAASGDVTSVVEPGGAESTYQYTLAGQLAAATNGEGETTSYHYDWVGRPTGVSAPNGTRSYIEYRDDDNETVTRSPMGRETIYTFDDHGRVRSKKVPSGRIWQYDYLPGGLLARVTLPDGTSTICIVGDGTIEHEYDALGRPTAIDYSDVSSDDVAWSYDDENSTATMTDGLGSEVRSYDGFGRLTETARSGHSTISYSWLGNNLLDTQGISGADPVDYDYDDDGLVASIASDSRTTSYGRDLAGNMTTLTHPDGGALVDPSIETRQYDPMGRITELEVSTGATQLLDLTATRDLVGRITELDRGAGEFERFEYDANGRVNLECFATPCDGSGGEWSQHAYDPNGNRTSTTNQSSVVDRFGYDLDDRLTRTKHASDPSVVREHDVRGQVTDDDTHAYWYTQSGALSGIADSGDPTPDTTFGLSGDDRRLTQTLSSSTTRLVWNDAFGVPQVAAELDGSLGTVERQNVFGPEGITMMQDTGAWYDVTHSPLVGNTELITDEDATIAATYSYGAFGNDRGSTGAFDQPYRFAGERLTPSTDNYHLRAREYDPSGGVFTSVDPVERSSSSPYNGTYNYAEGAPTRYSDPMGTCADHFNWLCDSTVVYMAKNPLETAGIATENTVGVAVGIGVNAYNTASGVMKLCQAGMSSATAQVPGLSCVVGAGEAMGSGAAALYNSCASTTRHHDAMGMTQCFGNTAWSATQQAVADCKKAVATSGYEAGKGCVGSFVLSAGSVGLGAAAKGAKGLKALDDLDAPKVTGSCKFSFAGDTLVLMGNGAWKPISDVRIGDLVWATDPLSGTSTVQKVLDTIPHIDHGKFVRVEAAGGSIVSTGRHPFWNDSIKRWQRVGTLGSSARVRGIDGDLHAVSVTNSEPTPGGLVYDLTVDRVHTFHIKIGDAAVLVHNSGPCKFPETGTPNSQAIKRVDGKLTRYIEYGEDGKPVLRVDMHGSHGEVEGPHIQYYDRHTNPDTGEEFVGSGDYRALTQEEIDYFNGL
ncbi:MAG: repeat protein [Thermoleophilia bacterium]|nr:repeat protein [Thermoleophilia bacterium]